MSHIPQNRASHVCPKTVNLNERDKMQRNAQVYVLLQAKKDLPNKSDL